MYRGEKFLFILLCSFILNLNLLEAKCILIDDSEFLENLENFSKDIKNNSLEGLQYQNALLAYEEMRFCLFVHQDTNKEFFPYLNRFLEYGKKYRGPDFSLQNLKVIFAFEKDLFYAGICLRDGVVKINYEAWTTFSSLEKQMIIDHEVGHCRLKRGHSDIHEVCRKENGEIWPLSLMRLGSHEYDHHIGPLYELYMEELFTEDTFPLLRYCLDQEDASLSH